MLSRWGVLCYKYHNARVLYMRYIPQNTLFRSLSTKYEFFWTVFCCIIRAPDVKYYVHVFSDAERLGMSQINFILLSDPALVQAAIL